MDPIVTKMFQSVPFAGMGTTLERNALVGVIRNLISESKYTVDYILDYAESVGYSRQDAEEVFKELTGLSPKLIVNNNEYYNMPSYVPNMCIAWGISKSNKDKAFYIVPFEYGYSVMEKDEVNAPISTIICATIPEAFEELKKVAKNIQTLDKIITKKLLETENVPTTADNPHQVNLPYSASPLQILKKNFKDKVLSVSEFEKQASKLLASEEITVDEAEDLMAWKQDLIDEDETYGNDVLELDEQWNEVQATLDFKDVYNEVLEMAAQDGDSLGTESKAETIYNSHTNLFKNVDLIEAATRLYQLLLGFTEDEILGHSKFEKKKSSDKVCPNCGNKIKGYPALSRKDNKTEICPECGQSEALESFFNWKNKKKSSKKEFYIVDLYTGEKLDGPFYTKEEANKALEQKFSFDEMGVDSNIGILSKDKINTSVKKASKKEFYIVDLYTGEKLDGPFYTKEEANKALEQKFSFDEMGVDSNIGILSKDKINTSVKKASKKVMAYSKNQINQVLEHGYAYELLRDKIITNQDRELFNKAVDKAIEQNHGYDLLKNKIITNQDREFFDKAVDQAIENGDGYQLLKHGIDIGEDKELFHKKQSLKKVTAENMTLEDIEAEDNKDEVQEEIEKIEDTPIEEIFEEKTPEQYFDKALQEDKVDTINDVVSKCIDKFSEKFKDFDKYTIKILSYNTKVLGEYTPVKEEMVKDDEINANAILQVILSIANNADETNIKKALAVFSITNGKLHWTGTVRGENDQIVAFTEEGLDALFEVEEPSEEELEDII